MSGVKAVTESRWADCPVSYTIRLSLRWRFAMVFILLVLGGFGLAVLFLQYQGLFPVPKSIDLLVALLCIFWLIFVLLLAYSVSTAWVVITLDSRGIHQHWSRQFSFTNHLDRFVCWADIVDYKFEYTKNWSCFEATLKDGSRWLLGRDHNSFRKDDFYKFRNDFIDKVRQYNQLHAGAEQIRRGETFLESVTAFKLSVLMLVLIVLFPIVLVILYVNNSPATALVGIIGATVSFPALFFVIGAYIGRQNRKEDD